jgi:septum formation inhibitor MinC
MVLNKHIPLLKSLCTILNLDEKELSDFKKIHPIDLQEQYKNQKRLLTKILKSLFKEDNVIIKYWQKQLRRINDSKVAKVVKSLSSTKSSSINEKYTL